MTDLRQRMDTERIIAYLLEELPEDDLERFEEECFAQNDWADQIKWVEEDLIDAYLRDELTPEQRQHFERNYRTTEKRRERVNMAAALLRIVDEYNAASELVVPLPPTRLTWSERFRAFWSSQTGARRAATSIAVIAVIAVALWLLLPRAQSPRTSATLILTISSSNRAEGAQEGKVKLRPDDESLNISLTLPQQSPPAERYRVELENDNRETKSAEVTGKDSHSVSVVIPASQLARERYVLKLFAIKTDGTEQRINGSYFFAVE